MNFVFKVEVIGRVMKFPVLFPVSWELRTTLWAKRIEIFLSISLLCVCMVGSSLQ